MNTVGRAMTVVLGLFGLKRPNSLNEQGIATRLFGPTIEAIDPTDLKIIVQIAGSRDKQSMPVMNVAVMKGMGI